MSRHQVSDIIRAGGVDAGSRSDGEALVDDFVLAYVYWREACDQLWRADDIWTAGPTTARGLAFAAYGACLDREATAADAYARAAARLLPDAAARRD